MAVLLFGFALAVRVAFIAADPAYEPRHDAFDYDRHARSIAAGAGYPESGYLAEGGPTALRAPAYPYLLGAVYWATGGDVEAGRLLGAVLGALVAVLVYLIARAVAGSRVALVAGVLTAVFPPLVLQSRELFSETLFIGLALATVLAVLRFRSSGGDMRWAAIAGALCGLAALARSPGLILLVPALAGVWVMRPRLAMRSLSAPALAFICALLVVAPWTARNAVEFGRFIPVTTSTGFALAGTYNQVSRGDQTDPAGWRTPVIVPEYRRLFGAAGVDEGTLDSTLRREAVSFAFEHPAYVAEVSWRNMLRLIGIEEGAVVAFGEEVRQPGIGNRATPTESLSLALAAFFAVIGAVSLARRRRSAGAGSGAPPGQGRLEPLFIWLVPLLLVAVAVPIAGLPRYRTPADPFVLILAAVGIVWSWDRLRPHAQRVPWRRAPLLAAALVVGSLSIAGCSTGRGEAPTREMQGGSAEASADRERFVEKANAICRDAVRQTRALGNRFRSGAAAEASNPLELTTEALVAPGLEIRDRQARRLRALELPIEPTAALGRYLDLFGPIEELTRQRLAAGRAGDAETARELERLILALGEEQREAARSSGLADCDVDFVEVAVGSGR